MIADLFNNVNKTKFSLGLVCLVIALYFFNVNRLTDNIPFADDYGHLLGFLNTCVDENSTFDRKIKNLWSAHTIHRTVLAKLTVYLEYCITGIINFKHITLLGNFALVFLFIILARKLKIKELGYQHLFVLSLLIFIPINTLSNWPLCTYGYFFLMLLATTSFIFLDRGGWGNFFIAALFAILSTLTYGAGIFVFLAGFSMLIVKKEYDIKHIGVWFVIFVAWSSFFLHGAHRPESYPPMFSMLFTDPLTVIGYFFATFGAYFKVLYVNHQWLKFVFGAVGVFYLLYLVIKHFKFFVENPFIACLLIYLILVAAGSAMNRSHFGIQYGERDKFHFIPALFLSLVYISSIQIYKHKESNIFISVLIPVLFLFALKNESQYKIMRDQQLRVSNQVANFVLQKDEPTPKYSIPLRRAKALEKGVNLGHYKLEASTIATPKNKRVKESKLSDQGMKSIIHFIDRNEVIDAKGWAFIEGHSMDETSRIYVVLENDGNQKAFLTESMKKREITQRFWKDYKKDLDHSGFKIILPKPNLGLPKGIYNIKIMVEVQLNNGKWLNSITDTNKTLEI